MTKSSLTMQRCRAFLESLLLTVAYAYGALVCSWGALDARAAEAQPSKRLLLVLREPSQTRGNVMIEQAVRDKLREPGGGGSEIYTEHLYAGGSRDFLREKYRDRRPDVILTTAMVASELAAGELIPGVPSVFMWLNPDPFPGLSLGTNITGIVAAIDIRGTLNLIFRLQPDTRRIVVIGGVALSDRRRLAQVEQASRSFSNRATFEFWTNQPMSELQTGVSRLPTGSVVLYAWMFRDVSGRAFTPVQGLELLLPRASVPVYVFVDSQLGSGAVGGAVVRYEALGARAAEAAQRILQGANPAEIPITTVTNGTPTFDRRALKRWGISKALLPPGSIVEYRQRTFWEEYRWRIVGVLGFCGLQTALIIGLFVNRAKRRLGEAEATLIADISSKFVDLPSAEVDSEIMDAERRICEFLELDFSALWQWSDEPPGRFVLTHYYSVQEGPQLSQRLDDRDYPWFVQQFLAGRTVAISSLEELPAEAAPDRETCRRHGVKSNLSLPLSVGGKPVGILGLNTTRAERDWPDALVKRLQLLAQIFANALARKRADQALRESELKYRELYQSLRDAAVTVDLTGRIQDFNPAYQELLGYSAEELRRLTYVDLTPERWHEMEADIVRDQVVARGYSEVYEKEYRRKDGTVFPAELRTFLIRDRSGRPVAMWAIVRDVTERKHAQDDLARLQKQNELILNSAAEGILGLDLQGNHRFINPAAARMLGYEVEELLGRRSHSLWHHTRADGGLYPEEDCKICVTLAAGKVHRESTEVFWRKDGTSFPVEYASTPICEEGRLVGAVVTFEDITERRRVEAELLRQSTALAQIARVSTMGELAASVAHQLNQPLGAILANAETLEFLLEQDTLALDEVRAVVAAIRSDDDRASEVIRRIRALFAKHEMELQPVDLSALVLEVEQLVGKDAAVRGVSLAVELTPGRLEVSGDRIHLQQALLNLIVNAMDAVAPEPPEKRRILVRTRSTPEGQAELAVIDSGQGIELDQLARLFEAFYTTKPHGMGMGLSIARTIVEAHRGRIWAENDPSGGATFCILLPMAKPEQGSGFRVQEERSDDHTEAPPGGGEPLSPEP